MSKGNQTKSIGEFLTKMSQNDYLENYYGRFVHSLIVILMSFVYEVFWVTGDLFIALVSIILLGYFKSFHKTISTANHSYQQLDKIHETQMVITLLVQRVAQTFSPLVLITVCCNVMYFLMILCDGLRVSLAVDDSDTQRFAFFSTFSFAVLRFTCSSYFASRLSEMVIKKEIDV